VTSSPWLTLLLIASGGYFAKAWWEDYRATREGKPPPHPLPGAHPAPARALIIAVAGSLVILAGETGGEWALGLTAEQSTMTVLFGIYTLVAAVIEEIIFRGYIVVEGRGATARWLGIFGASLVFAALHPFLWQWHDGDFSWQFTAKGWFSTGDVDLDPLDPAVGIVCRDGDRNRVTGHGDDAVVAWRGDGDGRRSAVRCDHGDIDGAASEGGPVAVGRDDSNRNSYTTRVTRGKYVGVGRRGVGAKEGCAVAIEIDLVDRTLLRGRIGFDRH